MHFITAIGYDDKGYIYANDPNKSAHPRKQHQDKFKSCLKQAFIFWPPVEEEKQDEPAKSIGDPAPVVERKSTGTAIVDVAKYEGNIDWDTLAPQLGFVVIKASGLYKNGADPQYANNVKGAVEHGVPFHVYHYLYSKSESEAKRDANLFYSTVMAQGHKPIVWVLDCEAGWGIADADAPKLAGAFEDELRRLAGKDIRVGLYVAHQKYKSWDFDYDHFDYIWIPRYGKNDGTVAGSVKPAYVCDVWQYTSTGKIAGINHDVDMNVLTGDRGKTLDWFIR